MKIKDFSMTEMFLFSFLQFINSNISFQYVLRILDNLPIYFTLGIRHIFISFSSFTHGSKSPAVIYEFFVN